MGKIKSTNEKRKSLLCFNFGGGVPLGGVVFVGGGLAVAGLMVAFSIIKNRNSGKDCDKNEGTSAPAATVPSEKKHDESPGLSSALQNPSTAVHQNSCCTSPGSAKIGVTENLMHSKELVSAQNMSLGQGDKTLPIMEGEKDILVSDDLNKEISESCSETLNNEESSLPAPESMIKNNSSENLQLMDNIEVKREEEETEKTSVEENLSRQSVKEEKDDADNDDDVSEEQVIERGEEIAERELALKENSPTQSAAEEEGDDDEDSVDHDEGRSSEDVTEKEEESSEGTGSSSMESNVEAIWPADMIEALSQELKEMNAKNQNSGEKKTAKPGSYDCLNCKNDAGEKKTAKPESYDCLNSKNDGSLFNEYASNKETTENSAMLNENTTQELVMEKVEVAHSPKREVFVWSLLAILLLLLLLYIHRTA